MPIQDPPVIEHFLLEQPWPAFVAFAAIGLVLFLLAGRQGKPKLRYFGLGSIALAVGILILSNVVTTERENVISLTHQLVHHTAPYQGEALERLLGPNAEIQMADGSLLFTRPNIFKQAQAAVKTYGIAEHSVRSVNAQIDSPTRAFSWVRVHTVVGSQGVNHEWLITWERFDDGQWRVIVLQPYKFNGQDFPRSILR